MASTKARADLSVLSKRNNFDPEAVVERNHDDDDEQPPLPPQTSETRDTWDSSHGYVFRFKSFVLLNYSLFFDK